MEQNKEDGFTLEELVSMPYQAFDKKEEYSEQVMPLVKQVHAKCMELGVPMFFVAAIKQCEDGDADFAASIMMNGPETTPAAIVAAERAANFDAAGAIAVLSADAMRDTAAKDRIAAMQQITRH